MRQQMRQKRGSKMNPLKMTHVSAMTQSSPERRSKTDAISGPRPGVSDVENVELSSRIPSKWPGPGSQEIVISRTLQMRLSRRAARKVANSGALAAGPFGRYSVDFRGRFGRAFLEYLKSMWEQRTLKRRSRTDAISGACLDGVGVENVQVSSSSTQ